MASVVNDPNGRKRILLVDANENRKAIRQGKIDRKSADAICRHIEALLAAKIGGQPIPRDTAAWLANIGTALHDRLARGGLVHHRQEDAATPALGRYVDAFLAGRDDLK